MKYTRRILLTVAVVALAYASFYEFESNGKDKSPAPLVEQRQPVPSGLLENESNTIEVFQKTAHLVTFVHNLRYILNFWTGAEVQQGAGSGFIWDDKGHIVTNFHVVQGADDISVSLNNGETLKAKIIGVEPRKDIAVLKVNLKKPPKKSFSELLADSSKLHVGQKSIAIGNPYGLDQTLTTGVISALGRSFPTGRGVTIRDMVQTDASINPGNSGGPLLNSKGELIGMNTAIYSASGASAGIGFAVPSNTIKRIVTQIIKYGKVRQPGIGISPLTDRVASYLGIQGVIIGEVLKGGPADRAGLQATRRDRSGQIHLGDVITKIDGQKIRNYDDLYNAMDTKQVGQKVKVTVQRNGREKEVTMTLENISS